MNRIQRDRYLEKEPRACQSIENHLVPSATPQNICQNNARELKNNERSKHLHLNGTKFHKVLCRKMK